MRSNTIPLEDPTKAPIRYMQLCITPEAETNIYCLTVSRATSHLTSHLTPHPTGTNSLIRIPTKGHQQIPPNPPPVETSPTVRLIGLPNLCLEGWIGEPMKSRLSRGSAYGVHSRDHPCHGLGNKQKLGLVVRRVIYRMEDVELSFFHLLLFVVFLCKIVMLFRYQKSV